MESYGIIEIDMFSEDVNDPEHPEVQKFKRILEDVAKEYNCSLIVFEIEKGTVSFSFDSDELMAEIIKIIQRGEYQDT